tara:strand:- start:522 stop:1913 length:1392 start_codon:yes stop_codon:yes gene_type:complete
MAFLIGGANSDSGAYQIDNSLRFSDSNYLTIDNTDENGEGVNFTLSVWLKMTSYAVGGYQGIFSVFKDSNDYFEIYKDNSEKLQICQNINGTNVCYQNQDFAFHDYSAWYHLVVSFNNSASGEINKIKVYINGTEISADEKVTNSNPFADMGLGDSAYDTRIGAYRDNTSATWNGYMAELHLVAGTTLTASSFGETDDNGVWIPIKYTGSYGENGFFLEFQETGTSQNASGMGADTSGNVNHLAVTGLSSVDVTTDTPTNNFATWNPVYKASNVTLSEGSCKAAIAGSGQSRSVMSTIAVASGKWYWEIKYTTDVEAGFVSVITTDFNVYGSSLSNNGSDDNVGYISGGNKYINGSATSYGNGWDDGDIVGVALNIDDNEVVFYKNGTAQNSGTAISKTFSGFYYASAQHTSSSGTSNFEVNFGNPTFSISSGNADANGYRNFEYAVPSNYYALCTKNLAEYG